MADNKGLETLRELVYSGMQQGVWDGVLQTLADWGPGVEVGLEYAQNHLASWPDRLCDARALHASHLDEWVDHPGWPLVRHLNLSDPSNNHNAPTSALIEKLLDLDVSNLRGLDAIAVNLSPYAERLFHTPGFANLTHFNAVLCGLDDAHMAPLAASRFFEGLTSLDLISKDLSSAGVNALVASPASASLRWLSLKSKFLSQDTAGLIIDSPHARAIEGISLSLSGYTDTRSEGDRWAEALSARQSLTQVHLRNSGLGPSGLSKLMTLDRLEVLNVADNNLGAGGGHALTTTHRSLKRLSLRRTRLGPKGFGQLVRSTRLPGLVELDVSENGIGDAGLASLPDRPPLWAPLRSLWLAGNDLTDRGVERLAQMGPFERTEVVDLSQNRVSDRAVEMLKASGAFPALVTLSAHAQLSD